ncbi:MAG: hypothetical protein QXR09_02850 [Candidatus Aenigmatarchaeota archaeon]
MNEKRVRGELRIQTLEYGEESVMKKKLKIFLGVKSILKAMK